MMNVSNFRFLRILVIFPFLLASRNIMESGFLNDLATRTASIRRSRSEYEFIVEKSTVDLSQLARKIDSNNNTTSNSANSTTREHRPILVLHVGPHKTGTSTIQCDLTYFQHLLHEEASFTYIGRQYRECMHPRVKSAAHSFGIDTRRLISCLDRHDKEPCGSKKEWAHLTKTLAALAAHRQNVIISDEAFSRMKINDRNLAFLHRALNQYFEVRVIIVYRHFYSWLLSQYNEHYKPLGNRKFYQKWPGEGGKPIHTFAHYYERQLEQHSHIGNYQIAADGGNYQLASAVRNLHPVVYLAQRWNAYAEKIVIVDMHQVGDLTTNFVHHALSPEASAIYSTRQGRAPGRPNPSLNLDSDRIVVRAREMGLLRKSTRLSRRALSHYVEQILDKKARPESLPWTCVNETKLDHLMKQSLLFESLTFPDVSNATLQRHESTFREDVKRRKFCNLNADSLLSMAFAHGLFATLNKLS